MSAWIPAATCWTFAAVNAALCVRMLRDNWRVRKRREAINELSRALLRAQEARLVGDQERCEAWADRFDEIEQALLKEFPELNGPTK